MHIYQILLLIGVVIASIMTSYSLVRTFVLLIKSNDVQAKEEKDLEKTMKLMIYSIILLTICSFVYTLFCIMDQCVLMNNDIVSVDTYEDIVKDILSNPEFQKLKSEPHHGISRYEHCLRVSKGSYLVAKSLRMKNLIGITRASLLHDFYTDNYLNGYNSYERLRVHPNVALKNARKFYDLSDMEADIIVKHMFPHTKELPKYKETYLVSVMDKLVASYEMVRFKASLKLGIYLLFIYNVVSIKMQQ